MSDEQAKFHYIQINKMQPQKNSFNQKKKSNTHNYPGLEDDVIGCFASVTPEIADWLWFPYLPRGCISFLEGPPKVGKSFFATYLAALISRGGRLPFPQSPPAT